MGFTRSIYQLITCVAISILTVPAGVTAQACDTTAGGQHTSNSFQQIVDNASDSNGDGTIHICLNRISIHVSQAYNEGVQITRDNVYLSGQGSANNPLDAVSVTGRSANGLKVSGKNFKVSGVYFYIGSYGGKGIEVVSGGSVSSVDDSVFYVGAEQGVGLSLLPDSSFGTLRDSQFLLYSSGNRDSLNGVQLHDANGSSVSNVSFHHINSELCNSIELLQDSRISSINGVTISGPGIGISLGRDAWVLSLTNSSGNGLDYFLSVTAGNVAIAQNLDITLTKQHAHAFNLTGMTHWATGEPVPAQILYMNDITIQANNVPYIWGISAQKARIGNINGFSFVAAGDSASALSLRNTTIQSLRNFDLDLQQSSVYGAIRVYDASYLLAEWGSSFVHSMTDGTITVVNGDDHISDPSYFGVISNVDFLFH